MMTIIFDSLKMNEAWANAPSLEHKSMSLKKTWFDQFLKAMMQVMIFENKWVRHVRMPRFDLKKFFLSVKRS